MTNLTPIETLKKIKEFKNKPAELKTYNEIISLTEQALSNQPKTFTIDEIREIINRFVKKQSTSKLKQVYVDIDMLLAEFEKGNTNDK